jgi:Glycosyl hydrolases family 2, sugar binding domain/Glycosyl hydrolases family 2/Glycosyl hydrolases family 2, TIM barrel domain
MEKMRKRIKLRKGKSSKQSSKQDFFERLTKQGMMEVSELKANPEQKLPKNLLPWDVTPGDGFESTKKITTQQELNHKLKMMREKYQPFLADFAPSRDKRPQMELFEFDWRIAEKSEWESEEAALNGKGNWTNVKIPHYEGPTGKAFSYYRKEIEISQDLLAKDCLFLHFQGVDYYSWIYVNGQLVGFHEGLFDSFEFDIHSLVRPGKNVILVKAGNDGCMIGTTPIYGGANFDNGTKLAASGGPGWDEPYKGWICTPVGFGLWQRVWLEARNEFFIHDIIVRPRPDQQRAEVWVEIAIPSELTTDEFQKDISAQISIYGQNFDESICEKQDVTMKWDPNFIDLFQSPQPDNAIHKDYRVKVFSFIINLPNYREWSPETPWLYQIQLELSFNKNIVDCQTRQFGMRSFIQSESVVPNGRFYLNGKEVRLRGANMMGNLMQCVIRRDYEQLIDDILLAKITHMNFWRMTQQPCQPEVYDYFDKLGMMAQSDLPTFAYIPKEKDKELIRQTGALFRMVRNHPSNIMVSYINEPMGGKIRDVPRISIADTIPLFDQCDALIESINPEQVVKWVDGDYANMSRKYSDHHCYNLWYWKHAIPFHRQYKGAWVDTREGWMHGCGEYGIEGLDSVELMKKYYPKEWLGFNTDGSWTSEHLPCQSNRPGFKRWIGKPKTLEELVSISREHQRVGIRLQVEALRRDPKMNSTTIHLLIDAWPAGWMKTIMDCERQAKPAFFEFIDAQTPISVNLRPDNFHAVSGREFRTGVWICNDTQQVLKGALLKYQIEMEGVLLQTGSAPGKIVACEPIFQGWIKFTAPQVSNLSSITLKVGLFDSEGIQYHDRKVKFEIFPNRRTLRKNKRPGGLWQYLITS